MRTGESAAEITRASNSNLALAFIAMSGQRRCDITTFYAFCRVIDDIADDSNRAAAMKKQEFAVWRTAIRDPVSNEPPLAPAIRELMTRYAITPEMLEEILDGVEMDVEGQRYGTWDELRLYCHRVASAVGLVSIEIFGYRNPQCREYAINLGLALQLTNIIRDVAADLRMQRVYLPADDLARFEYSERELFGGRYDERFIGLMRFEAQRAEHFFENARRLLPPEDRPAMLPAEIMRCVYHKLLRQMEAGAFRVFEKRYRLSRVAKTWCVIAAYLNFR